VAKNKDEHREAARLLFMEGYDQKKIAGLLQVNEKSVSAWAKDENWREKRLRYNLFREDSSEQVMNLIDFQLKVLNQIVSAQKELIDGQQDVSELKKLLIKNGELDGLQKLFTTLKGREVEWVDIVRFVREFTEFCNLEEPTITKAHLIPLGNRFIEFKRTQTS
jgi:predicted transcriptional regulator